MWILAVIIFSNSAYCITVHVPLPAVVCYVSVLHWATQSLSMPCYTQTVPCWFHQPFQCLSGIVRVSCMSSPWWHSIHSPVNSGPTFRCCQTELWGAWCLQGSWRKASQDTVKTIPSYLSSSTAKTPVSSCLLTVLKYIYWGEEILLLAIL